MGGSLLWLEYIVLLVILLAGFVLTIVTLPGTWLMGAALVVYAPGDASASHRGVEIDYGTIRTGRHR